MYIGPSVLFDFSSAAAWHISHLSLVGISFDPCRFILFARIGTLIWIYSCDVILFCRRCLKVDEAFDICVQVDVGWYDACVLASL